MLLLQKIDHLIKGQVNRAQLHIQNNNESLRHKNTAIQQFMKYNKQF